MSNGSARAFRTVTMTNFDGSEPTRAPMTKPFESQPSDSLTSLPSYNIENIHRKRIPYNEDIKSSMIGPCSSLNLLLYSIYSPKMASTIGCLRNDARPRG
ncbi:hypothetical protein SK128_018991 [Halocaridina rubra]|uniref:Uncharacterized protein n=1 Tax=Halocaridina rubra TaxID=373956 RepID=A0AAN8WJN2_HALRR